MLIYFKKKIFFSEKEGKSMDYKKYIAEKINVEGVSKEELYDLIALPPNLEMGDYALPCFKLAKLMRKSPVMIAEELKNSIMSDIGIMTDKVLSEVSAVNGYLNFKINKDDFVRATLDKILLEKQGFGASEEGKGKTICLDYSSINIAKPFHIGHLSTTVLGGALYRIFKYLGYNTVGINHLGDYGTQFGKLIVAFKLWSNEQAVLKDRLSELTRIYVKFHEEAEKNPALDDEARRYFKLIEEGDAESNRLFELFKKITLEEVDKIYKQLNVEFDSYAGESFYNDKMAPVVSELKVKGLLKQSDGASVVDLEEYGMPPCLILKKDGSSLYATRDIAAAMYRKNTYDFYKCLYVVAYQQNLHFKQVFKVVELMGKDWAKDMVHVAFGMVSLTDGAMSTRHGKVVLLEDVLNKAIEKAKSVMESRNYAFEDKDKIAKAVGTGAVIFGALVNNKIKDIVFDYDRVLSFDGETCPYVQYTVARCNSILDKCGQPKQYDRTEFNQSEYDVINILSKFNETIKRAGDKYEPSLVTRYTLDLAGAFNKFYLDCPIANSEENVKNFRLSIVKAVKITLTNALNLLGIETVERM